MSYPGLTNEHPTDAQQREHEDNHIAENIFVDGCGFCRVEKCVQCKGTGMSENCALICGKCGGIGRII